MSKMNDESIMPFGKYKGEKMANIPANYLIWLYDENKLSFGDLLSYIQDNIEALRFEVKNKDKLKS